MRKFLLLITVTLLTGFAIKSAYTQNWVGSEACQACHSEKYNTWIASGHPYKFTVIENGKPPVYPPEAINFQSQWI